MHAKDFAKIIKEMIFTDKFYNMNIATEENYSINQIANMALDVLGLSDFKIIYDKTKPNGQFRKDIDISILMESQYD